jgi:site-specific DNA-methyltransferase (adenine-specific)
MADWQNQLYFGDNLGILQSGAIPMGSVDLVYLDPPFNSSATYNLLFAEKTGEKSHAQITAFEDTWHWGDEAAAAYDDVLRHGPPKLDPHHRRPFCWPKTGVPQLGAPQDL